MPYPALASCLKRPCSGFGVRAFGFAFAGRDDTTYRTINGTVYLDRGGEAGEHARGARGASARLVSLSCCVVT